MSAGAVAGGIALAAAAAAWAQGLNPAMIVRALTTFRTDGDTVPARFNVRDLDGIQVIVDYAHNAAALAALGQAFGALGHRRTVMALTLPGDRRDDDLVASLQATLPYVDEYVLYEDADLRGRPRGEVIELLERRIPPDVPRTRAVDDSDAARRAWSRVRPGDRLVFIVDQAETSIDLFDRLAHEAHDDAACETPIRSEVVVS